MTARLPGPPTTPRYEGAVVVLTKARDGRLFWYHTDPQLAQFHHDGLGTVTIPPPPTPTAAP